MEESLCAKCAKGRLGGISSCVSPFVGKNPGFWLTLSDVAKIVKRTNLNPDAFCRYVELEEDPDDDEDEDLEERHVDLMSVGDKNILINGDKKCFFLGEKGCTIFEDRPKMCRVYPFWFKEKKDDVEITIEHEDSLDEDECLITKINYGNRDIPHLLSFIGETEEDMKKCIKNYIKEMELHNKFKNQLEKKTMLNVLIDNGFLDKNIKIKQL